MLLSKYLFFLSLIWAANGDVKERFGRTSNELLDYILHGNGTGLAYEWLSKLVDEFGSRQLGSESLEKAIDYVEDGLRKDGFDSVHTEEVPDLPKWIRGNDIIEIIEPRVQKLNALAIDGSPPANITAEAVVIRDFEELKNENVSGKIVVIAQKWNDYGKTVKYRHSASRLQDQGAVGVLVKSITPFSLGTPHTGSGARGASIPAATITLEEAEMLQRMYARGKRIVIRMAIESHPAGTTTSRNTIFEITGSEKPSEIVLLSAHLDSWDVGQGALDDGGGCAAVWRALHAIKLLADSNPEFKPKRTIRVVFWTAEEQGLLGAEHYYKTHKNDSSENFVFVSETDQGAFKPTNWYSALKVSSTKAQMKYIDEIVNILNDYGIPLSTQYRNDQGDVQFWSDDGIPSVNYVSDKGKDYYFYFHHTDADYINIFQEEDLDYTAAIFAVLAHVIANEESWPNV